MHLIPHTEVWGSFPLGAPKTPPIRPAYSVRGLACPSTHAPRRTPYAPRFHVRSSRRDPAGPWAAPGSRRGSRRGEARTARGRAGAGRQRGPRPGKRGWLSGGRGELGGERRPESGEGRNQGFLARRVGALARRLRDPADRALRVSEGGRRGPADPPGSRFLGRLGLRGLFRGRGREDVSPRTPRRRLLFPLRPGGGLSGGNGAAGFGRCGFPAGQGLFRAFSGEVIREHLPERGEHAHEDDEDHDNDIAEVTHGLIHLIALRAKLINLIGRKRSRFARN